MRSAGPSTNAPPQRRALHERTPSQTNETSPPESVRTPSDKYNDSEEENNVYTVTPFPTKPEHILPPRPGKGQEFIPDSRFHVDEAPNESTASLSTDLTRLGDSSLEQSIGDLWDLSSTFDAANTPSQVWEDDPSSSKSSLPDPDLPEHKPFDRTSDENSVAEYSDEELTNTLPTAAPTIKTVVSNASSSQPSQPEHAASSNSSPNVVPIGPPSSPNFVALDSSSLNFVRLGASSNPDTGTRSNSLSSLNSLGTVIRYAGAAPWTHGSSSEHSSSRSQSFRSNQPHNHMASTRSSSSRLRERSLSRATSSSRSGPPSDIQAIIDSGVYIQYPTIRAPSASSSRVDISNIEESPEHEALEQPENNLDRFRSHLSTVTSRWSAECESGRVSRAAGRIETLEEPSPPSTALVRQKPSSSVWLVNGSDGSASLDNVSRPPVRGMHSRFPRSLSSGSRQSSMRSIKRPATGSSFAFHMIPTWARMYYSFDGTAVNSALSLVEGSRPGTARSTTSRPGTARSATSKPIAIDRISTAASQPETREKSPVDPRDPRSHWVEGMEITEQTGTRRTLRQSWSPHLYPDRNIARQRGSTWRAPSLDSRTEPLLGRRNIQVWSFCLGFVCPLTWLVASFLPLPPKPEMVLADDSESDVETALQLRLFDLERKRYQNARWWRNLNRWMNCVGLVIIVIIIVLAVVGTQVGF
ncbi:conserved hypothetical protein [Aspergillus terreus NIH2624]|uniref:Serine-rich protein n=1 Tax=Aspergillus terreus (strain NIH 2624 / FGSC A1156) TaxID=341663 RepID=Q0CH82_ASPTN|nr:uncharacterized protein ATEG_06960 [Aspergillus terreus NIH2624]EAU32344.1 conserved hypothetical protein [Aspergillus terreus NIH2624]